MLIQLLLILKVPIGIHVLFYKCESVVHVLELAYHRVERVPQLMRNRGIDHRVKLILRLDLIIQQLVRDIDDLQDGLPCWLVQYPRVIRLVI